MALPPGKLDGTLDAILQQNPVGQPGQWIVVGELRRTLVTVAAEVETEIGRLFHVGHWRVGTIAEQLGIHRDVVRRVLGPLRAEPRSERTPLLVAPYEAFFATRCCLLASLVKNMSCSQPGISSGWTPIRAGISA